MKFFNIRPYIDCKLNPQNPTAMDASKNTKNYRRFDELRKGDYFYAFCPQRRSIKHMCIDAIDEVKRRGGKRCLRLCYTWGESMFHVTISKGIDGYSHVDDHSNHNSRECIRYYSDINALRDDYGIDIR